MNKGKTIFAQIMSLINEYEFKYGKISPDSSDAK